MTIVDPNVFAQFIRDELSPLDDNLHTVAQLAAESACKSRCGGSGWRTFDLTATSVSARVYGNRQLREGGTVLRVHDFCDTTGLIVSNNGSVMAAGTYQLEVSNDEVNGYDITGQAYQQIRILGNTWRPSTRGQALFTITAKWGWTAVPDAITEAVLSWGKYWVQRRDTRMGLAETSSGAAFGSFAPAAALCDPWRRVESYGI